MEKRVGSTKDRLMVYCSHPPHKANQSPSVSSLLSSAHESHLPVLIFPLHTRRRLMILSKQRPSDER
ncbi:hypothetical protein PCANC_07586 [Puccinia coronata f. sp. avenae]|uniref:Uncharacterized protein n=1 Tax=Puccinia coronata f. sp. avenae TaxID=200324 RepID=A0A2N5VK96_9BASI|nr:hypothetical protein PCANC_07586 [Puccinia coronata f. sp. avenae]